ncbi:methionine adenosyltransferase 2 subunit beta-like [Uloborus diversus]|uniref:methionine adenosyltransferase 2 subunit beta-like n=1 Tax=Uloborus diversus TaxID=327109 RepID=UPI00240A6BD5|nr:methionine adenosyltransferase 2 subunit beta-like [Uloborus diversus]
MSSYKVIITGASGLLGRALMKEFLTHTWVVLGFALSRAKDIHLQVDLTDEVEVEKIIQQFKPDVIVHSAAQRSPDRVEKEYDDARKLNVDCSKKLAEFARAHDAAFIYISTDYVFDGKDPPYSENADPNPLNLYGKTKLEGEREVMKINPDSCVLRIPVIYGDEEYVGESAVSSLIPLLQKKEPGTKISNYEIRYPCHVRDIAYVCYKLAVVKLRDPTLNSIFHWCGKQPLTKYAMAKTIAEMHNLPFSHILPDDNPSPGAQRPKDTQLSCKRLESLGINRYTEFYIGLMDIGIPSYASWISVLFP